MSGERLVTHGLGVALKRQGKAAEAGKVAKQFAESWKYSDVTLTASARSIAPQPWRLPMPASFCVTVDALTVRTGLMSSRTPHRRFMIAGR